MNLLIDKWIPVRPLPAGGNDKIGLKQLLCGDEQWEICLPRDDMELAAVQLLICITQVLLMPKTPEELKTRIAKPLPEKDYDTAIKPYEDWFQLDHPKYPFMQVLKVPAKDATPMDKLLAGLTGATSSCFVNERELASALCGGCAAIALFNQASCAPSFGGGFKAGLRGNSPVTTLVQGDHLRRTAWLNVLSEDQVSANLAWYRDTAKQKPTWVDPIEAGTMPAQQIGLVRGLLWQPAHIELLPAVKAEVCSCCGNKTDAAYTSFNKAKFSYTIKGLWPHPHSPRIMITKKGQVEEKVVAFTTSAPSWTQLSRFVVKQQLSGKIEGQEPAAVVKQVRTLYGAKGERLHLLIGGYRNNQASVLDRRHEVFTLNHGWDSKTDIVHYLVALGRGYRDALYKALYVFASGIKNNDIKGSGVTVHQEAEAQYYRRSEPTIENTLANIDFNEPQTELTKMRKALKRIAEDLFDESTRPYLRDPELIRTLAVSRRVLYRHLNNLEPIENKGGDNGTTETP